MMTRKILLTLGLLSASLGAQAESSFDLYAQGRVVESVEALRQELNTQRFNALTLNSQFQRLMSAYQANNDVTDEQVLAILTAMLRQPQIIHTEHDVEEMLEEVRYFHDNQPSLAQGHNYLRSAIIRGRDTSIIPNDPDRLAKIRMTRIYALRKAQRQGIPLSEKAAWTYLAGKAGFYRFNTGNSELSRYIQMCDHLGAVQVCRYVSQARSMLNLGESIENVRPENN